MNTYNEVPGVSFKPLNQTKVAIMKLARFFKDFIPVLFNTVSLTDSLEGAVAPFCRISRMFAYFVATPCSCQITF